MIGRTFAAEQPDAQHIIALIIPGIIIAALRSVSEETQRFLKSVERLRLKLNHTFD